MKLIFIQLARNSTISTTASSLKGKTLNVINTTSAVARSKLGKVGIGMALENAAEYVGYYAGIASALPVIELLGTVSRIAAQNIGKHVSQTAVHTATIGLLFAQLETIRAALYREKLSTQKLAELASSLIVVAGMNYSIPSMAEEFSGDVGETATIIASTHLEDIWGASQKKLKLNDEVFDNIADNLEESLHAFEVDLIGIQISKETQKQFVKECLKTFLPNALNFMFLNTMNELRNPKASNDPRNVYAGVSHFIFSYYSNAIPFGLDFIRDTIHEQIFNAKLLPSVT